MEVDGSIEGDVTIEEGLSTQCDQVAAHGEKNVGKQEGDARRWATSNDDPHHRCLGHTCGLRLHRVVWTHPVRPWRWYIIHQEEKRCSTHSNTSRLSHQLWCHRRRWSSWCDGDNSPRSAWTAGLSAGWGSWRTAHASASRRHLGSWRLTWECVNLWGFILQQSFYCSTVCLECI